MAGRKTRLELTWIGKDERPRLEPRILLEDPELSYRAEGPASEDDIFDNMLIHGDNLLALKALEQTHRGAVQCVYIDPPFNTGAAFDHYEDGLEHSVWLSLMVARARLLRELLASTGSLFVHLDDNELDYLKVVLDEVFGRSNFVGRMTVDARSPSAFSTVNPGVFKASEYLLWYAKDKRQMKEFPVRVPRDPDPAYTKWIANPDDHHSKWEISTVRKAFGENVTSRRRSRTALHRFVVENANHVFRLTSISDKGAGKATVELKYESKKNRDRVFRLDRAGDLDPIYILNGQQISFYDKNVTIIDGERTASMPLTNVWTDIAWEGIAREGGVKFKKGKKPEKLVKRCLELTTEPGDLVLDSFAGSGTTGAVAHKMRRRWIQVELGPHCLTHLLPRLRSVIRGEDDSGVTAAVQWNGGGGFRFYRLAPSLLEHDKWGNWVVSKKFNGPMLAEAMCKLHGFRYDPDPEVFWLHGRSTETDFLYVTDQTLTADQLRFISDDVGPDRTLLICCRAWRAKAKDYENLTLEKIPQSILSKCEWARDDYSLNVEELTPDVASSQQDDEGQPKREKRKPAVQELPLFAGRSQGGDQ